MTHTGTSATFTPLRVMYVAIADTTMGV